MSNDAMIVGALIPIVAIVFGLVTAMVAVVAEHLRKARELHLRHLERMAAIEKGLELPPDPVKAPTPTPRERYLLRGLLWLGVGLATALGTSGLVGHEVARVGWIAAAVGAAFLIFYVAESRRKPKHPPDTAAQDRENLP